MSNETIEEKITEQDQLLLDIIEAGDELTDQQEEKLMADPQLADDYRMLVEAKAEMLSRRRQDSVEERLTAFKASHQSPTRRKGLRFTLWSAVGAVAAAVACLIIWLPTTKVTHQEHNVPDHIFTADMTDHDVTLTASDETIATVKKTPTAPYTEIDADRLLADSEPDEKVTLLVPLGKSAHLTLPDGSQVWLYPDSRLKFPHKFIGNTREVVLEGQAYFSVVRNEEQPFIVMANGMQTTVLGTEFVVSAYEDMAPNVALVSGKVEVKKDGERAVLMPGKQAKLNADGHFSVRDVDTEQYVQWRDGYFYFDNVTVHDILLAIGRNYNVCVICPHPETLDMRMRFIADRNEPLANVVQRLNEIGEMKVVINGNMIEVR
ncbi:MAG: FecR domain-containing protein [Prevotellaceae bacterium]|nr:FecR domain-containing protein [Prevotellaceae bacterium]